MEHEINPGFYLITASAPAQTGARDGQTCSSLYQKVPDWSHLVSNVSHNIPACAENVPEAYSLRAPADEVGGVADARELR